MINRDEMMVVSGILLICIHYRANLGAVMRVDGVKTFIKKPIKEDKGGGEGTKMMLSSGNIVFNIRPPHSSLEPPISRFCRYCTPDYIAFFSSRPWKIALPRGRFINRNYSGE